MGKSTLYAYAAKHNWTLRIPNAARRAPGVHKKELTRRLLRALESRIGAFEQRHVAMTADGAMPSAADAERDARTLGTLVRLFERLQAIGAKPARAASASTPASATLAALAERVTDDTDSLRDALARRLETLRLQSRD